MTKHSQLISLAAIAAFSLFNGAARADDGGSSYDDFPLTVAAIATGYQAGTPATCAERKADAAFLRQLQLNDGDVYPVVEEPVCATDDDMIAQVSDQDD